MSLISYAQNFEDVLLWRALGHVKNGFYIDVGANDPNDLSVTKALYERGWHGINVEPLPQYHQAFIEQRPRDINLCVAAGAEDGEITLFDVPSVPGWASSDASVVAAHQQEGFDVVPYKVPLRTLRRICDENVSGDIHFLKIDVEGFEAEVIRGMDFARWRPWVLVIEATLPNSPVVNYETWESMVTSHDYQFAYFDGLNRFYVASEHSELLGSLQVQANVFDHFISWQDGKEARALMFEADLRAQKSNAIAEATHLREIAAEERANATQHQLSVFEENLRTTQEHLRTTQEHLRTTEEHLRISEERLRINQEEKREISVWAENVNNALANVNKQLSDAYLSTSWRITKPIRWCGAIYIKHIKGCGSTWNSFSSIKSRIVANVYSCLRWIVHRRLFQSVIRPCIAKFPALEMHLIKMMSNTRQQVQTVAQPELELSSLLSEVPQSARTVLADLQRMQRQSKK